MSWFHLSALGGLNVTVLLALAIAAWLVGARCWRLALAWCLLFGATLAVAGASQMAFLGWGIGWRAFDFTGFSGHAARAAAVFPVALVLLVERHGRRAAQAPAQAPVQAPVQARGQAPVQATFHAPIQSSAAIAGVGLAVLVAIARVKVRVHSPSEAAAGCLLGLGAAAWFLARMHAARGQSSRPLLIGLLAATLLLPRADPLNAHQWLTAAALKLSGNDRVYLRRGWQPAQGPYVPPCVAARVRFDYLCT